MLFFLRIFKKFFGKENWIKCKGISYIFDIRILASIRLVFPKTINLSKSSRIFTSFPIISKGKLIKQFFSNDKWDLGMNKIFFSDSIIIDFIKVIYFSINFSPLFVFSSPINE